jgi:hypothetical protein
MRPYAWADGQVTASATSFGCVPERFAFGHTDAVVRRLVRSGTDEGVVMIDRIDVVRDISATPDVVWALVSDLPRMGNWSPENDGGEWVKGATGPAPGAKFKGRNANGSKQWSTGVTVLDATPGERFSFAVTSGPFKIAEWAFDIEATDGGCRVTETWSDQRGGLMKKLGGVASGVDDRVEHNRTGMEATLAGVAAAAEVEPTP